MARNELNDMLESMFEGYRKQGRKQGEDEEAARILLRLLNFRFGELPSVLEVHFSRTPREQLEQWTERVLTARSLVEVFEGYGPEAQEVGRTTADELRQEGRQQGEKKEAARLLLRLLKLRFGEVPAEVESRVSQSPREQLEQWAERVLTAGSLAEVFDDESLPAASDTMSEEVSPYDIYQARLKLHLEQLKIMADRDNALKRAEADRLRAEAAEQQLEAIRQQVEATRLKNERLRKLAMEAGIDPGEE